MFRSRIDQISGLVFGLFAAAATVVVVCIGLFLGLKAWPAVLDIGPAAFSDSSWNPSSIDGEPSFGMMPMLVGSCLVTAGAAILATPIAISISIYSQYFAFRPVRMVLQQVLVVAAAIPSVVYGLWGVVFLVPFLAGICPPGTSLLAGTVIVTLMIVPTIAIVCTKSLQEVQPDYVQAAVGLGLGRMTIICRIILPIARKGLVIGIVMGVMRAVGETMAVVMVCGNIPQIPTSIYQPIRTLTANIALEMGYALDLHQSVLFLSATVLLFISILLVGLVHLLSERNHSVV